jgi:hypothetical protein
MLAIKAKYKNGKITLLEKIPVEIRNANLTIVIEPEENIGKPLIPAEEYKVLAQESETEYELIGLNAFFETEDDKNVDWEEYFGLK